MRLVKLVYEIESLLGVAASQLSIKGIDKLDFISEFFCLINDTPLSVAQISTIIDFSTKTTLEFLKTADIRFNETVHLFLKQADIYIKYHTQNDLIILTADLQKFANRSEISRILHDEVLQIGSYAF